MKAEDRKDRSTSQFLLSRSPEALVGRLRREARRNTKLEKKKKKKGSPERRGGLGTEEKEREGEEGEREEDIERERNQLGLTWAGTMCITVVTCFN